MQEDFYVSYHDSLSWSEAISTGKPLNTFDNEGAQSISANGKTMVYTVCNRKGIIGRCDLYFSEKFGDEWSEPVNMGYPINTKHKENTAQSVFRRKDTLFCQRPTRRLRKTRHLDEQTRYQWQVEYPGKSWR
jgi:hypothetical protein